MSEESIQQDDAALFTLLSRYSKRAFSVADAARRQLSASEVEIAHLLYGLYKRPGATRATLQRAGIDDGELLEAIGIPELDENALGGQVKLVSEFPPLHAHARRALEEAEKIRVHRRSEHLRMRHFFSGILKVTECSLVERLVTEYGVTFDLDEYEATEASHANDAESSEDRAADDDAPEDRSVTVSRIGRTAILAHATRRPWKLPVDAFTLRYALRSGEDDPTQLDTSALLQLPVRIDLRPEELSRLKNQISEARKLQPNFGHRNPLLIKLSDDLRAAGLPPFLFVMTYADTRQAAASVEVAQRASREAIARVTIPLLSKGDAVVSRNTNAIGALRALIDLPDLANLDAITITTDDAGQLPAIVATGRSLVDQRLWKELDPNSRRALSWAASVAGSPSGTPSEIGPLQLLGGLLFATHEGRPLPVSEFLLAVLSQGLSKDKNGSTGSSQIAQVLGLPPTASDAQIDSLPPLAAGCRAAIEEATRLRPSIRAEIKMHDLIAGLLVSAGPDKAAPAAVSLSSKGFDLTALPNKFLEYIARFCAEEREHWKIVVRRSTRLRPSAPTRACIDNDDVRGEIRIGDDRLDIVREVDRFARLLVAKDIAPPISLGLFGNWGTGKTFFMGLLKTRIRELSKEGATYVAHVAQIDFNAWHYVDTNLWASLAMRIFDGLAKELRPDQIGGVEAIRREIHTRIDSSKKGRQRALQQQDAAKQQRAQAQRCLTQLQASRLIRAGEQKKLRLRRVFDVVLDESGFKSNEGRIKEIVGNLGISTAMDSCEDVSRVVDEVRSIRASAGGLVAVVGTLFSSGKRSRSITAILGVLAGFAVLSLGIELTRANSDFLRRAFSEASVAIVQLAALVSAVAAWASRRTHSVSEALRWLERLRSRLQQVEAESPPSPKEAALQKEIDRFDAEIRRATETMSEADRRIAEAERELQRLNEGGLVYDFLSGRRQSARYLDQLGLISTIRGDFEELGELLKDFRQHGRKPIERIVLFVDDLDRCHPDRVVEVLQAVHLLLAFDLFSVVVGVDARWLERSLYRTYVGRGVPGQAVAGSRLGSNAFSPQNYLEKIFQIPYSLQGMKEKGFEDLVGHLVISRSEHENGKALSNDEKVVPATGEEPGKAEIEKTALDGEQKGHEERDGAERTGDEDNAQEIEVKKIFEEAQADDTAQAMEALFLEDWEERYMQALHEFIPTPRLAKRFVNVYRLLRVRATERDFDFARFIGDEAEGDYQAALLLLAINIGFPSVGGPLLHLLCKREKIGTWEHFLKQIDPTTETPRESWANLVRWSPEQSKDLGKVRERLTALSQRSEKTNGTSLRIPEALEAYVKWAPEVGRYSFQWHIADGDWDFFSQNVRRPAKSNKAAG